MRILLAEDEVALAKAIVKIFEKNNFSIDAVYDGEDALFYIESGNYDVAILDIMMPKMDGLTVLKKVREEKNPIPILLLTAKAEVEDKVLGLDCGANDYLSKPFDSRELLARIRALTRGNMENTSKISMGNITLDRKTFELSSPFGCFHLTKKEFQLMEYFLSNPKHVLSSDQIMERVWGFDSDAEMNVVWVYLSYLRKKLSALKADVAIKASRNAGYYLEHIENDPEA